MWETSSVSKRIFNVDAIARDKAMIISVESNALH